MKTRKKNILGDFFGNSPLSHIIMLVWCDFYAFGFLKKRPTCVGSFNLIQNKKNRRFFIDMEKGCVQTQFSSKFWHLNDCVDKHLFL